MRDEHPRTGNKASERLQHVSVVTQTLSELLHVTSSAWFPGWTIWIQTVSEPRPPVFKQTRVDLFGLHQSAFALLRTVRTNRTVCGSRRGLFYQTVPVWDEHSRAVVQLNCTCSCCDCDDLRKQNVPVVNVQAFLTDAIRAAKSQAGL